jgi:hypothetical protein
MKKYNFLTYKILTLVKFSAMILFTKLYSLFTVVSKDFS